MGDTGSASGLQQNENKNDNSQSQNKANIGASLEALFGKNNKLKVTQPKQARFNGSEDQSNSKLTIDSIRDGQDQIKHGQDSTYDHDNSDSSDEISSDEDKVAAKQNTEER